MKIRTNLAMNEFDRHITRVVRMHAKWLETHDYREPAYMTVGNADNYKRAEFESWELDGAKMPNADLRGAVMCDTMAIDVSLRGADLRGADMGRMLMVNVDLSCADLRGANMSGVHMVNVNMAGAVVDDTIFEDADLRKANTTNVDFTYTDVSKAMLF